MVLYFVTSHSNVKLRLLAHARARTPKSNGCKYDARAAERPLIQTHGLAADFFKCKKVVKGKINKKSTLSQFV